MGPPSRSGEHGTAMPSRCSQSSESGASKSVFRRSPDTRLDVQCGDFLSRFLKQGPFTPADRQFEGTPGF